MTTPTGPTQAEIDAAAERVSRVNAGEGIVGVYVPLTEGGCRGSLNAALAIGRLTRDRLLLSDTYLANLAAESARAERDAKPITAEWLDESGAVYHDVLRQYSFGRTNGVRVLMWEGARGSVGSEWFVDVRGEMANIPAPENVGQLRALCSALGCPLPESEGEA